MLLSFDVEPSAIIEHDDWHTHEHLPERLSIPGFIRGTRWIALRGEPRYFVMYEVEQLATLSSQAYLDRLNHPTPWTAKMMPHYRSMTRGFCSVAASFGSGLGGIASLVRLQGSSYRPDLMSSSPAGPERVKASTTRDALLRRHLPLLSGKSGIGSVHWFAPALMPEMTTEQRIRGADAAIGDTLLLTGYRDDALRDVLDSEFMHAVRDAAGAEGVSVATFRLNYSLAHRDFVAGPT